jgi:hypothetical protein
MLRLVRVSEYNGATMGALCFDGKPEMLTLEEPWRDNEARVSCIPEGKYTIKRHRSPKFGITFKVEDVPERSNILFHSGNTANDTEGCILLGQRYGNLATMPAVLNSQKALNRFMQIMNGLSEANLIIISAYGGGRAH